MASLALTDQLKNVEEKNTDFAIRVKGIHG